MSARRKDNERERENDESTAGFEKKKKWLKICKPTFARSVTCGGWKPKGMRDNVSSARALLLLYRRLLMLSVVRTFFMLRDPEGGFPRGGTSLLSSRNGTDICLPFRG